MLKLVCLALGHRCRVVQEFSPVTRRVKCKRCGGDWAMHDGVRIVVPWGHDLERLHRDHGHEILEPLPAWLSLPFEPLTFGECVRACRWSCAVAIALSSIAGHTLSALETEPVIVGITTAGLSWGIARFMGRRALQRAYERKSNTLKA